MSLEEDIRKKFGKRQEVSLDSLHPPMAPKPIVSETLDSGRIQGESRTALPSNLKVATSDSKLAIDFSYLANNSSFQRGIMEFIKKFVPGLENVDARGTKQVMAKSFDQNAHNYREVMKELKLKLQEKRSE